MNNNINTTNAILRLERNNSKESNNNLDDTSSSLLPRSPPPVTPINPQLTSANAQNNFTKTLATNAASAKPSFGSSNHAQFDTAYLLTQTTKTSKNNEYPSSIPGQFVSDIEETSVIKHALAYGYNASRVHAYPKAPLATLEGDVSLSHSNTTTNSARHQQVALQDEVNNNSCASSVTSPALPRPPSEPPKSPKTPSKGSKNVRLVCRSCIITLHTCSIIRNA